MTIKNHLYFFWTYAIVSNLAYFLPLPFFYFSGYFSFKVNLIATMIILFFVITTTIYLHLEYYRINKTTVIYGKKIFHMGVNYSLDDLVKVYINKSVNNDSYDGNLRFKYFPFEDYYYLKLYFKGNKQLILTCLLDPKIDEKLKELCPETQFIRNGKVFSPFPDW